MFRFLVNIFCYFRWIFFHRGLLDIKILIIYFSNLEFFFNMINRYDGSSYHDQDRRYFYQNELLDTRKSIALFLKDSYGENVEKEYLGISYTDLDAQQDFVVGIINKKTISLGISCIREEE